MKELKEWIKNVAVTYIRVAGHFNEDAHSKNMQEFMTETSLFKSHEEVNGICKEEI